ASLFVGENLDVVIPPDRLYDHSDKLCLQKLCRRNSSAVCKLATPYDPALSTMAGELARKIAADLETRLSMAAQRREPYATYGGETYYNYPPRAKRGVESLDDWAMDILKWTDYSAPTARVSSRYRKKPKLTSLESDSVAPSYEAFFLFVAHYVKAHISGVDATGLKSEDCRLILPIAKNDTDDDNTNVYVVGRDDPMEFSNVECGLFPLSSSVERQTMSASHLIVANVEIVRHLNDFNKAEPKLVRKTKELFTHQHNRRFAWGLATSCHTVHAYVFGPEDIWQSSKIDVSGSKGHQKLVSLLVDWSLCSVDRCYGVTLITNEGLAEMEDGDISAALREIPSIYGRRDPLIFRDTFENEIVESLFRVLAEHRNAFIAKSYMPLPTVDEQIRARFPPGAIYNSSQKLMDTIYERRMRLMSSAIRSQPDWMDALNSKEACLSWAVEAKAKGLTSDEFNNVLDDLRYYEYLALPDSNIRRDLANSICILDMPIDAETRKAQR
ncbi:hypothetical protein GGF41_002585, partial [Coemansia sp. RSA 2531]